jgi:hypothetical protein
LHFTFLTFLFIFAFLFAFTFIFAFAFAFIFAFTFLFTFVFAFTFTLPFLFAFLFLFLFAFVFTFAYTFTYTIAVALTCCYIRFLLILLETIPLALPNTKNSNEFLGGTYVIVIVSYDKLKERFGEFIVQHDWRAVWLDENHTIRNSTI